MIKNIIFDIGRVLLGFEWDEYMKSLFDDEEIRKSVTNSTFKSGMWEDLDEGIRTTEEIFASFISLSPQHEKEIREALARVGECTTRCDYAIPWIEELKARGYNVYYLSNYSEYVQSVSQHALDFLQHMNGGVFSCEVHSIKPNRRIYEVLFERYSLDPSDCIFIDDRPANVDAGKALGMEGIVFDSYKQAHEEIDHILSLNNRN